MLRVVYNKQTSENSTTLHNFLPTHYFPTPCPNTPTTQPQGRFLHLPPKSFPSLVPLSYQGAVAVIPISTKIHKSKEEKSKLPQKEMPNGTFKHCNLMVP